MTKLDVEQQLRLQKSNQATGAGAPRASQTPFMTMENLTTVAQLAILVLGCASAMAALLAVFMLKTRKMRDRSDAGLTKINAPILTTYVGAPLYSLLMAAWLILVGVNATLRMMEAVSMAGSAVTGPLSLLDARVVIVPLAFFCPQFFGVVGLWLYPSNQTSYILESGVLAALLVFFPSFYQSLVLDSAAPERSAVWTTHAVFLTSLFMVFATAMPWGKREYHAAVQELRAHTHTSLYRDRPELRELRAMRNIGPKNK